MAKPPHSGSKLTCAEFVFEKVCNREKKYKVIQPAVMSNHDDTYFWIAKIITIDGMDSNVRIPRKHESGFVIVSENAKHKFKIEHKFLEKAIEGTRPKKN